MDEKPAEKPKEPKEAPAVRDGQEKVNGDLDGVRALIDATEVIENDIEDLANIWNTYTKTVQIKSFKNNELGVKLDELEKIVTDSKTALTTIDSRNSTARTDAIIKIDKLIVAINKLAKSEKLKSTAVPDGVPAVPAAPVPAAPATSEVVKFYKNATDLNNDKVKDIFTPIKNNLDSIRTAYNDAGASDAHNISDIKAVNNYFTNGDGKNLEKNISEKVNKIKKESDGVIDKLKQYSQKYGKVNTRIMSDVYLILKPKQITKKSKIDISDTLNDLKRKMFLDIKANSNNFKGAYSAISTTRQSGGQRGGNDEDNQKMKDDRKYIEKILKKSTADPAPADPTTTAPTTDPAATPVAPAAPAPAEKKAEDVVSIFTKTKQLKELTDKLYKLLTITSDPAVSNVLQGNESLFNILYNKYLETKQDPDKGNYVATAQLLENLKQNDLMPEDVLEIDLRDKFVFIFASLFIRLIALSITEALIQYKKIARLDIVVLTFLAIYTGLFVIFVLIVNLDAYKLRIIFNYINFHNSPQNAFTYITLLWLFGWMIYYIMYDINGLVLNTATSDEDRIRLRYKIQVLSMISWIFVSMGVLMM